MTDWFARPVLHVSSVEASLRFFVDRLGFTIAWRHEEDGRARVAQVDRGGCALIFPDQWADKIGKDGPWGYRLLVVEDLDGNQLFFSYPNEPESCASASGNWPSPLAAKPSNPQGCGSGINGIVNE